MNGNRDRHRDGGRENGKVKKKRRRYKMRKSAVEDSSEVMSLRRYEITLRLSSVMITST